MLGEGADIRRYLNLLGHSSSKTTELHTLITSKSCLVSSLDSLNL
ncbi:integrase [Hymenobacter aerilatus]